MSKGSSKLVDVEPGGESSQYESIRTVTEAPAKQAGQMGSNLEHTKSEMKTRDYTDEGKNSTEDDAGLAQKLGNAGKPANSSDIKDKVEAEAQEGDVGAKTRGQQRYGPGSGVGA